MIDIKKILQYTGGMNRAGAETLIMNVFRNFDRDKYEFHFISHYKSKCDYDDEILKLGGKIIYLEEPKIHNLLKYKDNFNNIINKYGPYDAIHCHVQLFNGVILKFAKDSNIPIRISHAHTNSDCRNNSLFRILYRSICIRLIDKYSTFKLACSNDAGKNLYKKNSFLIFNNAIDLKKYNFINSSLKEELHLKKNEKIILHIGRFVQLKNHIFILEVFKELLKKEKNYKLVLVGDGELFKNIKNKVRNMNLNNDVFFLGIRSDIPNIMGDSEVFFMPSLIEGVPVSLIEAQASGLPCIISNNIPLECDVGLNLVKRLSLNEDKNLWVNYILNSSKHNIKYSEKELAFNKKGFNLYKNIELLDKLYSNKLK